MDIIEEYNLSEENNDGQSPWAINIPEEILLKILQYAIVEYGPVPLLCRTALVCSYWRDVSYNRDLWKSIDLSSGWIKKNTNGIKFLCESRLGEYTKCMNLEAWFKIKDEHLQVIDKYCPSLRDINLSSCDSLSGETLYILADQFPLLDAIKLSYVAPIVLGTKAIAYFLQKKGPQLKQLVLSNNDFGKNFGKNMADIYAQCLKLEHLDLSHVSICGQDLQLDISALQKGCPKLRVLNLQGTSVHCKSQIIVPGFLDLEEFYVPNERVSGESVPLVLKTAFKLKKLEYYICSAQVNLLAVPATGLEYLKLPIATKNTHIFQQIKWASSLNVLDINWMEGISRVDLDNALIQLFSKEPHFDVLKELHLCGTHVSWHGISAIIEHCRKLSLLNCTFCDNIPKFWAREIKGELLCQLYKLVNEGMAIQELRAIQDESAGENRNSNESET